MTAITEAGLTSLQLMELHTDTLFRVDPDGRLRCVNEPGDPPAPRFFMGRTPEGNLWRFRHDLPDDTVRQLEALCQSEPVSPGLAMPPRYAAAIKAALQRYAPIGSEYRGPAYRFPAAIEAPKNVVLVSEANAPLLQAGFPWLLPLADAYRPVVAVIAQDMAVAVCYCSRRPGRATEAGAETLATFRGKGYATAAVAAWALAVRRRGIIPLYGTSWGNLASRAVARKLGMVEYGEDWSLG